MKLECQTEKHKSIHKHDTKEPGKKLERKSDGNWTANQTKTGQKLKWHCKRMLQRKKALKRHKR